MKRGKGRPLPLGLTSVGDSMNFSIAVESGKSCQLVLYKKDSSEPLAEFDMPEEEGIGEVRFLMLEEMDSRVDRYVYRIDGEEIIDPYTKDITGKLMRSEYYWEDDRPLRLSYSEIVSYALHVRGFTNGDSSNVVNRGTFAGIIEKLPYLCELGINQIQLMPIYETKGSEEYTNYWGYGPGYYFAPKRSYSTSENPVKEFKDLIKACHKQGIEVVLDMAFAWDTSKQMMLDCLRFYVAEFHVDGFILNPDVVPFSMVYEDSLLKGAKIFRYQPDFQNDMRAYLKSDEGKIPALIYWSKQNSDKSIYNFITSHNGFTLCDLVSYSEKHNEENGEDNLDGTDYNLSWNCGVEGPTDDEEINAFRLKQMKNAFTLLLLSRGIPCILAGDEFANTQNGNNNAYCQDNAISWLDWNDLEKNKELYRFVRVLITLRKSHPVFSQMEEANGTGIGGYGIPDVSYHGEYAWQPPLDIDSRQLGICYNGKALGDADFLVAYNMYWEEKMFALPVLPENKIWHMILSTDRDIYEEPMLMENQRKVSVPARTIAVFIGT